MTMPPNETPHPDDVNKIYRVEKPWGTGREPPVLDSTPVLKETKKRYKVTGDSFTHFSRYLYKDRMASQGYALSPEEAIKLAFKSSEEAVVEAAMALEEAKEDMAAIQEIARQHQKDVQETHQADATEMKERRAREKSE